MYFMSIYSSARGERTFRCRTWYKCFQIFFTFWTGMLSFTVLQMSCLPGALLILVNSVLSVRFASVRACLRAFSCLSPGHNVKFSLCTKLRWMDFAFWDAFEFLPLDTSAEGVMSLPPSVCLSVCLSVRLSVRPLLACLRDNSSSI